MKNIVAIIYMALLTGCSSVVMKQPFPESQLTNQEINKLRGIWQVGDTPVHVAFDEEGTPWMAQLEWKDNDFQLKKYRLYFTRTDETLYVSMSYEPDSTNRYVFAELKADSARVVAWMPNVDFFKQQVEDGILQGRVDNGRHASAVFLDASATELLQFVSSNPKAIDYKTPLVFERMK